MASVAAVGAGGFGADRRGVLDEVFLLSAVLAARNEGADTDTAVADGIQRTGRIITTAAALIIIVFAGFATGRVLIITQLGLGLAAAIALAATIVRLALTPALMTLLGRHNWIGPRWAHRTSQRLWQHDR
jgi:RND superfamily putative drug exporter